MAGSGFLSAKPALTALNLSSLVDYYVPLLLRNLATIGFVFIDPRIFDEPPGNPQDYQSRPGCIIASPSYHRDLDTVSQNYVFNWVRDSAIVAVELAHAQLPQRPSDSSGPLDDYVEFAALCQTNSVQHYAGQDEAQLSQAKFTIEGAPVAGWPLQNDGPALQTLALLAAFPQLSENSQNTARALIAANVSFILRYHQQPNFNLWEEVSGQSLFTRSVQLQCLGAIIENNYGLPVPDGIEDAKNWLSAALDEHWQGTTYVSILDPQRPRQDYDPNADVVAACIYGAIPCIDPKLLSTAAQLRQRCTDPVAGYPINSADAAQAFGPLIGRYPGDVYDGDVVSSDDPRATRNHPWGVCTANYAELYYRVATAITASGHVPDDPLAQDFLTQAGVSQNDTPTVAAAALIDAGDRMLSAIVYHSDHLELSEQFDAVTGFEKSVRNLSWSYAAVLSALRARDHTP